MTMAAQDTLEIFREVTPPERKLDDSRGRWRYHFSGGRLRDWELEVGGKKP